MVAGGGGKLDAKEVFAVHEMNGLTRSERGFQFGVICLPSNNLGVGPCQVRVNNNFAGVRNEHLPDVRQEECLGRLLGRLVGL